MLQTELLDSPTKCQRVGKQLFESAVISPWDRNWNLTGLVISLESCKERAVIPARRLCNDSVWESCLVYRPLKKSGKTLLMSVPVIYTHVYDLIYNIGRKVGLKSHSVLRCESIYTPTIFLSLAISHSPSLLSWEQKHALARRSIMHKDTCAFIHRFAAAGTSTKTTKCMFLTDQHLYNVWLVFLQTYREVLD